MKKQGYGISLIEVYKAFGTTEACLNYLEAARWPEGVRCLVCGTDKVARFTTNETEREYTDDHGSVTGTARVPSRRLYQCNEENLPVPIQRDVWNHIR